MTINSENYQKLNQIDSPSEEKLSMKDNIFKTGFPHFYTRFKYTKSTIKSNPSQA